MVLHRKAITEENLKEALRRLRYPVSEKVSKLYVQCFGNFEVLHYPSKRLWQLSVKKEKIDCDYYDYLAGERDKFRGEYMSQFSFAEGTLAQMK